jgi:ketoreductase RED2
MRVDLHDKVALVTGSSSGIGAATARALAACGAKVVVNSARSVEAGETLARELPNGSYVQADVADAEQAASLVHRVIERHGQLDVLVNNAGTTAMIPHHDLEAATPDVWRRIFDVNVIGTWQVSLAAVPHLRAVGDAAIVNVSSVAGHATTGSSIPYAASKAAVSHMTRLLANVLGPHVRVNAVAPGLIDTPWTADWEIVHEAVRQRSALQRVGSPEDVADVIVSLVGARYMTGQVALVDGGLTLFR